MNSTMLSLAFLAAMLGAAAAGMLLRRFLPAHHTDGSSNDAVHALPADDARHRHLKDQALVYNASVEHESLLLVELAAMRLQLPLMLILLSWLVIICLGFGLVWPRAAIAALMMPATAFAGAILMILELTSPLRRIVRISP